MAKKRRKDKPSLFGRILGGIERAGNRLPHPITLFALFTLGIILVSALCALLGVSATGELINSKTLELETQTVTAVSLLSKEGVVYMLTSMVSNFTSFAPLGVVLVTMLGIGCAEGSGYLSALLKKMVSVTPRAIITPVVVLLGVMSNIATDIGYVVLIPVGALVFMAYGRHPLAGLAAAFAGVSGGFSANLLIGALDPLLAGISTEAAHIVDSGYTVLGAEGAGQADYILLPMPMDAEAADLARILRAARPGTLALGGRISEPVRKAAQAAGVELVDYFLRPELACLNAVPTAEGCLALLMQLRQRTIWESEFLVLGYGRIGRAVARRLQALGGQVTVAARAPEQRAAARCAGLHAAPLTALEQLLPHFDAVINTIPAPVLGAAQLRCLPRGALILDLASRPGGTDFAAARELGLRAEHALSLPARCAPETAGALVAHTVEVILQERAATARSERGVS